MIETSGHMAGMLTELGGRHASSTAPGAPHLARRGAMIAQARALVGNTRILIADDNTADVKYMLTTIRIIVGSDVEILTAPSIRKAVEAVQAKTIGLVFIDDRISGKETFEQSIPQLRGAGFGGPLIVISGFLSPERRRLVFELGAVDALHKDDLEGLRLAEAVVRALSPGASGERV